jgi:lipopolysaccharide/colanic/teichoic acid biosynthesis glycosyltransferase
MCSGRYEFDGSTPSIASIFAFVQRFQNKRHELLPGITGWVQVNGRNTVETKFEYDVWYVDVSLCLDLKTVF